MAAGWRPHAVPSACPGLTPCLAALRLAVAAAGSPFATDVALAAETASDRTPGRPEAALHVPSPDWRDQVIYFVMTDRFDDGDPANNDQRAGEFDPADRARSTTAATCGAWSGGWTTSAAWARPRCGSRRRSPTSGGTRRPITAATTATGPRTSCAVDAHLGTLADYRALSTALHGARHVPGAGHRAQPHRQLFRLRRPRGAPTIRRPTSSCMPDSRGHTAPSQWPFSLNDARDPSIARPASITGRRRIADYNDPAQTADYQMAGPGRPEQREPGGAAAPAQELWPLDPRSGRGRVPRRHRVLCAAGVAGRFPVFATTRTIPASLKRCAARPAARTSMSSAKASRIDKPFEEARPGESTRYMREPTARPCCRA